MWRQGNLTPLQSGNYLGGEKTKNEYTTDWKSGHKPRVSWVSPSDERDPGDTSKTPGRAPEGAVDDRGRVNSSYKGGEPGFVRVIDDRTIAFPSYDGPGGKRRIASRSRSM